MVNSRLFLAALDPGARIIPLVSGRWTDRLVGFTVVSACDFERLSKIRWSLIQRYAKQWDKNKRRAKQLAYWVVRISDDHEPDHINHEKLDNRRCNLRSATRKQQTGNSSKWNKRTVSKFKGVYPDQRCGRWYAVCADVYLGKFDLEIDAAVAYDNAAFERWGEFAVLNRVMWPQDFIVSSGEREDVNRFSVG